MEPTVTPISQTLESLHENIIKAVEPLTDAQINWAHPHLSNTIGILLRHIAGSERYWIGEVVGGRVLRRNRDAEFTHEPLQKAALLDNLRRAHQEIQEVMRSLTAGDLLTAIEVKWGGGMRTITKEWAIIHSVEHAAYHLGQIQLFRKMATTAEVDGGHR